MTYMYDPQLDDLEYITRAEESSSQLSILGGPALPALGHAISGATGAAISNVITYPLALAITRLQVQHQFKKDSSTSSEKDSAPEAENQHDAYKSISDALSRIYAEEGGLSALYTGCAQDTCKTMADSFLFFLAYNFLRRYRKQQGGTKKLPVHEELLVGMLAGGFSKFFTTPVAQIVTRKQTGALSKRSSAVGVQQDLSVGAIARQIRQQKGIRGFWSGYSASLVLTLNPSLTFLFHETLLRMLVRSKKKRADPGARITFLLAALSKALASMITYPFSLAKARAQVSSRAPLDDGERFSGKDSTRDMQRKAARKVTNDTIFGTLLAIAREEGVTGLYQGLSGEVMKGFFSHGLTMLMKERIHKIIIQLYYAVLRLAKKYPSADELASMAGGRMEEVREAVGDAAQKAVDGGREVVGQGQEVLDKAVEAVGERYGKGKEGAADILDDYVNTDEDDNGWGW